MRAGNWENHRGKTKEKNSWISKKKKKKPPYQHSSSLYPPADSTPSAGPRWLSLVFGAPADSRLLSRPGTITRGTRRTIRAQKGTEKHEQDNKCSKPSCTTDRQQRKLQHKRKSWFPVHVCNVSVSPSACPIWVQWRCLKEDQLIQVSVATETCTKRKTSFLFSTACCIVRSC